MERKDFKRTGSYEASGHGGIHDVDESTVELTGTAAEADLIVRALVLYVAEQKKLWALRVTTEPVSSSQQVAHADKLLDEISETNYVAEEKPSQV